MLRVGHDRPDRLSLTAARAQKSRRPPSLSERKRERCPRWLSNSLPRQGGSSASIFQQLAVRGVSRSNRGRSLAPRERARGEGPGSRSRPHPAESRAGDKARSRAARERRVGWGGRTRTSRCRLQRPVPYQFGDAPTCLTRRGYINSGAGLRFPGESCVFRLLLPRRQLFRRSAVRPTPTSRPWCTP